MQARQAREVKKGHAHARVDGLQIGASRVAVGLALVAAREQVLEAMLKRCVLNLDVMMLNDPQRRPDGHHTTAGAAQVDRKAKGRCAHPRGHPLQHRHWQQQQQQQERQSQRATQSPGGCWR
jgi:hypothetical protein